LKNNEAKARSAEPSRGVRGHAPQENFENQESNLVHSGALWTTFFTSENKKNTHTLFTSKNMKKKHLPFMVL
jgi:hypothetical protein